MGLDSGSSSDPDCEPSFALFSNGEKVRKKPCKKPHLHRHANDSMRKKRNPGPGENLKDLSELERQRSAPQPLLNSVLGENLEDLRHFPADPEEQEFQRSAPNTLLNSVQHEKIEDLHVHHPLHDPEELDCQRPARTQTLLNPVLREYDESLASNRTSRRPPRARNPGSSALPTNCSAVCRTGSTRRGEGHRRLEILGTSITRMTSSGTISAVRCKIWSSTPPIEDRGTGTSIICTGTKDSMIGSTVRRRTRACGPATSGRGAPRRAPHQRRRRTRSPCHWLSSGPVGRCASRAPPTSPSTGQNGTRSGGAFQPGPLRRSSVRAEATNGGVAPLLRLAEPVVTRSTFIMMSTAKVWCKQGHSRVKQLVVVVVVVVRG